MATIRKAIPEDASVIAGFQQKMAWETEKLTLEKSVLTPGVNAVFVNPACGQYWVAEENGNVVASLLITYEWSDWRNTNLWWIQSVYVLSEFRRKGIFRSMYSYIRNEADKQGVAGLRLYVETNNTRAQKTYEALGMHNEHYQMYEWLRDK
jgi:ribosomal protein S18 acetylase RimI-like enzyme